MPHVVTQSDVITQLTPCSCIIPIHLSSPQAAAAGTGGGRRGAGQEQRVTAETPAEEEPRRPEKSPAYRRFVREQ